MTTIRQALQAALALPPCVASDAPLLLAHVLGKDRSWLYAWPDHPLSAADLGRFHTLLERRRAGEPLAYLTGSREFWSLELQVSPATLIPRPETELLVELALELQGGHLEVLDLGTGSGAIAIALASERPAWQITATDISGEALAVAKLNARRHRLGNIRFLDGHWFDALPAAERYHLILSNPPYVAEGDPHLQENGLPHEPATALTAGPKGLDDLRRIIRQAPGFLLPGGRLMVEHGWMQGEAVRKLFRQAGFTRIETHQDLARRDRVTLGCYSAQGRLG